MRLQITIESSPDGVVCSATTDLAGLKPADVNLHTIGALEIAKASLLAQRWGVNVGGFDREPLIKPVLIKKPRRKNARFSGARAAGGQTSESR